MRTWLALAAATLVGATAQAEEVTLFNGNDLTGWDGMVGMMRGDTRKAEEFWSVKDGALYCAGGKGTWAALHTQRKFTNFRLQLEFRWGEIDPEIKKAGGNIYNSGVFLRSNPRAETSASQMPFTYQAQIVHTPARTGGGGGTGDLWITAYDHPTFKGEREPPPRAGGGRDGGRGGQAGAGGQGQGGQGQDGRGGRAGGPPRAPEPGTAPSRSFPPSKFAEKPIGEWNTYDITFNGDKVVLKVNGEQVNSGTGAGVVAGRVGLECENTPISFRNLKVTTLD